MVRSSVPCFPETVNLSSMVRSGVPMVFGPWCLSSMVGCVFRGGRLGYIILYAQPGGSEHRSPVLSDLRLNIIGRAFFRGAGAGLYYCLGELSRWNV